MSNSDISVEKQCGFCAGKGRVSEDGFDGDETACPVCQGKGNVTVSVDTSLHQLCDGRGKMKLKTRMGKVIAMCPECKGTGWF